MSERSPRGAESCQGRRFTSLLVVLLAGIGCSTSKKPNYTRTQPDELPSMDHRQIETTRGDRGDPRVDSTIQEPQPLTGVVEIKTWADEVIRGRVVSERPEEYVLDVGPLDGSNPRIRKVPRSAVMEIGRARQGP